VVGGGGGSLRSEHETRATDGLAECTVADVTYSNIAHTNSIIFPSLKYSLIVRILDTSCIIMPEASHAQNSAPK
jgi:hypothetical protein